MIQNGTSKHTGDDDDNLDNEDWGDDLPSAVEHITTHIKGMIQTDDLDKPLPERCEQFNHLIEVSRTIELQIRSKDFLIAKEKRRKIERRTNGQRSCR